MRIGHFHLTANSFWGKVYEIERTTQRLQNAIHKILPEWSKVDVTHSWRGLVCTSRKFAPSVGQAPDDPSLLYGLAYHGNGVAAATWTGRQMACVVASRETIESAFPGITLGMKGKIPFAKLRPSYVRAVMALRTLGD